MTLYAFHPDLSAMGFNQVPSNGQSQTSAAAGAGSIDFVKPFKDAMGIFCRNTNPGIFDLE